MPAADLAVNPFFGDVYASVVTIVATGDVALLTISMIDGTGLQALEDGCRFEGWDRSVV